MTDAARSALTIQKLGWGVVAAAAFPCIAGASDIFD